MFCYVFIAWLEKLQNHNSKVSQNQSTRRHSVWALKMHNLDKLCNDISELNQNEKDEIAL